MAGTPDMARLRLVFSSFLFSFFLHTRVAIHLNGWRYQCFSSFTSISVSHFHTRYMIRDITDKRAPPQLQYDMELAEFGGHV